MILAGYAAKSPASSRSSATVLRGALRHRAEEGRCRAAGQDQRRAGQDGSRRRLEGGLREEPRSGLVPRWRRRRSTGTEPRNQAAEPPASRDSRDGCCCERGRVGVTGRRRPDEPDPGRSFIGTDIGPGLYRAPPSPCTLRSCRPSKRTRFPIPIGNTANQSVAAAEAAVLPRQKRMSGSCSWPLTAGPHAAWMRRTSLRTGSALLVEAVPVVRPAPASRSPRGPSEVSRAGRVVPRRLAPSRDMGGRVRQRVQKYTCSARRRQQGGQACGGVPRWTRPTDRHRGVTYVSPRYNVATRRPVESSTPDVAVRVADQRPVAGA